MRRFVVREPCDGPPQVQYRGQGRGKLLVTRLIEAVTHQGCTKLVLTPGGYDIPYEQQEAFYLKCGFRLIETGLMEYP